jgi:putative hemolysin
MILLYPIAVIFELMTKTIEKIFKVKTDDKFTEEDFENVIEKTTSDGLFEQEQTEIIQSALEFIDTNVREVLTPKKDVFALDINTLTHDKMKEILLNTNYSRIPVYDQQPDNIIGILIVKTYFKEITKNTNVSIRKILSKPYFVPNTIMIDDLFNGFKKNHSHIAIVRDKDHKMVGMVTMEDVLEELVSGIGEPNTPKEKK